MNAYERRQEARRLASAERAKRRQEDKAIRVNSIMAEFEEAYRKANGREVEVKYDRGWYYSRPKHGALGYLRHREQNLLDYTRTLWARVADAERRASMEHPEYVDT